MQLLLLIAIATALVSLGLLAMGVRILFHRSHRFPETSAGHNPKMRRLGITCPRHQEIKLWGQELDVAKPCATCYEHARDFSEQMPQSGV